MVNEVFTLLRMHVLELTLVHTPVLHAPARELRPPETLLLLDRLVVRMNLAVNHYHWLIRQ